MPSLLYSNLSQLSPVLFEIPTTYRADMRVPARVFLRSTMLDDVLQDTSLTQLVNVTTLPGIVHAALAMPDIHQGYGFPIGGVAAMSIEHGVISPGGIGYDINCGVRLLGASIKTHELKRFKEQLATALFHAVPSGVGRSGTITLSIQELDSILTYGAKHALKQGYGIAEDLEYCENYGSMHQAQASCVSDKAKNRGRDQLGTLGSGNHFIEVQKVETIYDHAIAEAFGLEQDQVTVMIHCGSRGLGHQTCTDYVKIMLAHQDEWGIILPDKELACAPITSPQGRDYFAAMAASANFAWANRHIIGHCVRQAFTRILGPSVILHTIYDVSHNVGKKELHTLDNKQQELLVHRKGATRAFPAGHPEIPERYKTAGHPVLIPGTMGTSSYVLVGTQEGLEQSFGSCCHGAGRKLSRMKATKLIRGKALKYDLEAQGITIRCESERGLAEEAPLAYKDVDSVVQVVEQAGIARKVAQLTPLAVIKG
jgi:tRNA-splicing ligase RtcB